jgi:hypothetical protein
MTDQRQIVPLEKFAILNLDVPLAFSGLKIWPFIRRAWQADLRHLGDIVTCQREELRKLAGSELVFRKILATLHANGFDVAMAAPGWVRPAPPYRSLPKYPPAPRPKAQA